MNGSLLAHRYAHALGKAIDGAPALENASGALNEIAALYESDETFRHFLLNPSIDAQMRLRVADHALTGFDAPDTVARLVRLLLERNRIALLPDIARHMEAHTAEWLRRAVVTVVTAAPLTEESGRRIVASLERFSGKTVLMKTKVDPDIIGGLVVYMWGISFDFSLRTRLERLKEKLLTKVDLTYES